MSARLSHIRPDPDTEADTHEAQCCAEDRAYAELQVSFLLALNDGTGKTLVPHPVTDYALAGFLPVAELPWKLKHQPVSDAVFDALCSANDPKACDEALFNVLGQSECPLVKALKVALSEAYAGLYAPGLVQIDAKKGVDE